jgi:Tfp pilus assembly protein PilX
MIRGRHARRSERGATLIVSLILLTLITVMLASTFSLSSTNLKSVGNTQVRNEAIAAANAAIEQVVSSPFTNAPAAESINVDINNDGVAEYTVNFAAPKCVSAIAITPSSLPVSSLSLGSSFASTAASYYQTVWDLDATVIDTASGASVHLHQGVRKLLNQAQYTAACP